MVSLDPLVPTQTGRTREHGKVLRSVFASSETSDDLAPKTPVGHHRGPMEQLRPTTVAVVPLLLAVYRFSVLVS